VLAPDGAAFVLKSTAASTEMVLPELKLKLPPLPAVAPAALLIAKLVSTVMAPPFWKEIDPPLPVTTPEALKAI